MSQQRFVQLSVGSVGALYLALMLGIALTPALLSSPVFGWVTVGRALLITVHVLPVMLGVIYLRRYTNS